VEVQTVLLIMGLLALPGATEPDAFLVDAQPDLVPLDGGQEVHGGPAPLSARMLRARSLDGVGARTTGAV